METDHAKPPSLPSITTTPPPIPNFQAISLEKKTGDFQLPQPPLSPLSPKPCPLWASNPNPNSGTFKTASMYYQPLQGAPSDDNSLNKWKNDSSDSSKNQFPAANWVANFPDTDTVTKTVTETESMKTRPIEVSTTNFGTESGNKKAVEPDFEGEKNSFSLTYGVLEDVAGCFWPYGGLIFDNCIGFRKGKGKYPLNTPDINISGEKNLSSSIPLEDLKPSENCPTEAPSRVTVAQLEATTV